MSVDRAEKSRLRVAALARRDQLTAETRIEYSLRAATHGLELVRFEPGTIVSGFFPIRSEIDARPLMDRLRLRGAVLCLPVVLNRQEIVFRELTRETGLVPTGFGTVGPPAEAPVLDPQIMIMPLAAYDGHGNRIGYGAGHYDRAIHRLELKGAAPRRIGLAFSIQRVAHIPAQPHDRGIEAVITELGVEYFRLSG
jgi:5-formyltetrahydrofolate cyclo-ligase